jgi:hypothetical protein
MVFSTCEQGAIYGAARLMQRDATVERTTLLSREQRKFFIGSCSENFARSQVSRMPTRVTLLAHQRAVARSNAAHESTQTAGRRLQGIFPA